MIEFSADSEMEELEVVVKEEPTQPTGDSGTPILDNFSRDLTCSLALKG